MLTPPRWAKSPKQKCKHDQGFHLYPSIKRKQCTVCKKYFPYEDSAAITTHKRRSTI